MTAPERRACGAGLMMTPLPAASADSTEPAGMATGKFHGGATTVSARRDEARALHGVEFARTRGVVVGEVDRLADLRIGFGDGLAGLGRHDLDEAVAVGREREPRAVEHRGALVAAAPPPGGSRFRHRRA